MIVFRYLAREVLASMFAVSLVLLMIIFSARFVKFLAEAAAGKIDAAVLLTLMAYKSLGFLELILPLGLFIGILLAYGRLYLDSEMTVLSACGVSERRILGYTLITSFMVAIVVSFLSMHWGPQGVKASVELLAQQRNRTDLDTLKPARFNNLDSGRAVSYAESISKDKKQLNGVFIAELASASDQESPSILVAESGRMVIDPEFEKKFLLLKNGKRYKGRPGEADYEVVAFDEYYQLLPEPDYSIAQRKATDGMTTLELYHDDSHLANAALQWRLSLPVLVMVVGFLAVPLSRTKARQGRYGKLLPAILVYIIYVVCLNAARGVLDKGEAPFPGLLWAVHLVFACFALVLYLGPPRFLRRKPKGASPKTETARDDNLASV